MLRPVALEHRLSLQGGGEDGAHMGVKAAMLRDTEIQGKFSQGSKEAVRELAEQQRIGTRGTMKSNLTRVRLILQCALPPHCTWACSH